MENYSEMKLAGQEKNNSNKSNFSLYDTAASSATPSTLVMTTPSCHHHQHNTGNYGFQQPNNKNSNDDDDQVNNNNINIMSMSMSMSMSVKRERYCHQPPRFYNYGPLLVGPSDHHQQEEEPALGGGRSNHKISNNNNNKMMMTTTMSNSCDIQVEAMKAKIVAHPHYSNLLQAYMDCQKVGAPPEVAARLAAIRQEFETRQRISSSLSSSSSSTTKDPELDQFMEAYYDMLVKYREELTRPVQEAMDFMTRIESQLNLLTNNIARPPRLRINSNPNHTDHEKSEGNTNGSSDEEQDNNSGGETELPEIDPRAEDRELKNHLLRKYSGYLSSLKQELSKKKKKGKLPKEARQKLLSWWELHYKWPYPSESEKVALAEATGLDQKQINNWFINQRKRHWKPSEDMQFMVMGGIHPQNAALYMEGHYLGEGPYRVGT